MKKIILSLYGFMLFLAGYSQSQPTSCPAITYSYDAAGNRISRLLVNPCEDNTRKKQDKTTPDDSSSSVPLNVKVYPNPTRELLTVDLSQANPAAASMQSLITMVDVNGRQVHSEVTSLTLLDIDVSSLGAGVYYLSVTQGGKRATYSVLKEQ